MTEPKAVFSIGARELFPILHSNSIWLADTRVNLMNGVSSIHNAVGALSDRQDEVAERLAEEYNPLIVMVAHRVLDYASRENIPVAITDERLPKNMLQLVSMALRHTHPALREEQMVPFGATVGRFGNVFVDTGFLRKCARNAPLISVGPEFKLDQRPSFDSEADLHIVTGIAWSRDRSAAVQLRPYRSSRDEPISRWDLAYVNNDRVETRQTDDEAIPTELMKIVFGLAKDSASVRVALEDALSVKAEGAKV